MAIAIFLFYFIVGMAGAALACLIARPIFPEWEDGRKRRLKPWRIGVAVLVMELALVGAAAADQW